MKPPATATGSSPSALDRMLRRSRSRWRTRRVLEGAAVAVMVLSLASVLGAALMDLSRFDAQVVEAVRRGLYALMAGALALFVAMPLFTRLGDRALARYLEARSPQLDALVISAVDAARRLREGRADGAPAAGTLPDALLDRAARALDASPVAEVEQPRARRALLAMLCMGILALVLWNVGPVSVRHGLALLFAPGGEEAARNPYVLEVQPGDTVVLAGTDLRVEARVQGFEPEDLALYTLADGGNGWQRAAMQGEGRGGRYEQFLFDVRAPLRYQVRDGDMSSPVHTVQVTPRPLAQRIDLRYHYPERTGRAPRDVEDGGDIEAVVGSRVELRITPSHATGHGRLVIDGERSVPLRLEDGVLRGELQVAQDGRYRVELEAGPHGMVPASAEHAILARADSLPTLALLSPGRDVKVTRIEEVVIAARAEDDVAVRDLELVMSVNGGAEEVMPLADPLTPSPSVEGALELFLEERELAPGDLIAYYLRARDAPGDESRLVKSDIFFMDVRPFDMSFRRGGGGGGGGGGQNQGGNENLAAQQRSLVVALFKLDRDRATLEDAVVGERVALLADAQARIRTRTDAIVRRLGARSIVNLNPGYRQMAEQLPEASKAMQEVEAMLGQNEVGKALPAARTALLHLQRADAAMREVQVSQARQGGGGGDAANDLSNLFRLEMDRFRNQYEDLRRGNWQQRDRELDDTLRKLKELAERQQRELERDQARGGPGSSDAQRALAEEVEQLVRELERLTRQRQDSEEMKRSARELADAARAMRRAAEAGDARGKDEALRRLRSAREQLDRQSHGRLQRQLSEAQRDARAMQEDQEQIARAVQRQREAQQGGGQAQRQSPAQAGAQDGQQSAGQGSQPGGQQGGSQQGSAGGQQGGSGQQQGGSSQGGQQGSSQEGAQGGPQGGSRDGQQGGGAQAQGPGQGGGDGDAESRTPAAAAGAGSPGQEPDSVEAIVARKESLADRVREMEALLDRLSVQARQDKQAEAARALKGASDGLRARLTGERLRQSAQRLDRDPRSGDPREEADIARGLSELRERLAGASSLVGESGTIRSARMLERLRDSMRGVDRARERLADAARRGARPGNRAGNQGGTPSGSQGGGASSGGGWGGSNRGGGGGGIDARDIQVMREGFAARDGEILSLAEALRGEEDLRGELGGLLQALDGVRGAEEADAQILALRHGALLSALQALERRLRDRVKGPEVASSGAPRAEALPGQREQVETYYRNLSEQAR